MKTNLFEEMVAREDDAVVGAGRPVLSLEEARERAQLRYDAWKNDSYKTVVDDKLTAAVKYGWIFFPRTEPEQSAMAGSGAVLVLKQNGKVYDLWWFGSTEDAIKKWEKDHNIT